jgi:hypothetical protein
MRAWWTLVVLGACAEADELGMVEDALAPPGNTPALVATLIRPGGLSGVGWGGPPGASDVWIAASRTQGAGPCPPQFGGECLDLLNPVLLGSAQANVHSLAEVAFQVPANLPAGMYYFQGLAITPTGAVMKSNVFARNNNGMWQCTLQTDQVCGYDGVTYDNECTANAAGIPVLHWGWC